jgi:hypothetical protein
MAHFPKFKYLRCLPDLALFPYGRDDSRKTSRKLDARPFGSHCRQIPNVVDFLEPLFAPVSACRVNSQPRGSSADVARIQVAQFRNQAARSQSDCARGGIDQCQHCPFLPAPARIQVLTFVRFEGVLQDFAMRALHGETIAQSNE